ARVAGVADVAAVLSEQLAAGERAVRERGPVVRRRRVERVDREPDDDRDDGEERKQGAETGDPRRDQHPLARVPRPADRGALGRARVVAHATGGAIASATSRVSRRLRSVLSVKIVMPMFTICTIPESTIIAPKIPRAMK